MVKHGSRGHGSQAPVGKSVAVQAPLPLTGGLSDIRDCLRAPDPTPEAMRAHIEVPPLPPSEPPPAPGA